MDQLVFLMTEYPEINKLIIIMVVARFVFKTLFTILAKYVELSIETEDDTKLKKVLDSKWYKLLAFSLDLTLSIKLVTAKKKKD